MITELELIITTHLLNFLTTVVLFNYSVGTIVKLLWINAGAERKNRFNLQTSILGKLEASIYYTSFFLYITYDNLPVLGVIGAWLTLKTLPSVWKNKVDKDDFGSERFNIYLIGNLLNLFSSFIGSYSTFLYQKNYVTSSLVPLVSWQTILFLIIIQILVNTYDNSVKKPTVSKEIFILTKVKKQLWFYV